MVAYTGSRMHTIVLLVGVSLALVAAPLSAQNANEQAGATIEEVPDFSQIRGANYVPSYASTSVGMWKDFDPQVIDRELALARRLSLNSVRVFLPYVVYEDDPQTFLKHVERFVELSASHNIRPMFVLFDSCFGDEPSLDKADSPTWVNNPGYSRIGKEHWPRIERYASDVVGSFRGDSRVLMWDIMNEPMADFAHVTRKERDAIWEFCRHFCAFVKKHDPNKPITVGHAVVEYIPKTIDLVDVASVHSYSPYAEWLDNDLDLAFTYADRAGKPVIVSEFGNPGAGQPYEMALDVIERRKIGFYFWELMIAKVQFREMSGLVYPDGTIREPAAVARLLGFPVKQQGGIPLKPAPDTSELKRLLDDSERWSELLDKVRQLPRKRESVIATVHPLSAIGRVAARPGPEAMEIFELGLTIGQLFRMKRDAEALEHYDRLLDLVEQVVQHRSEKLQKKPSEP